MDLPVEQFMSIGIVGVALSLMLEWAKSQFNLQSVEARMVTILASVMLGTVLWFLNQNAALLQTIMGVLATASMVYAIVIKSIR